MTAPALKNLDRFTETMEAGGLIVRRHYVEASVGPCIRCCGSGRIVGGQELCPRCGGGATEAFGHYWQLEISREKRLDDGRLWARILYVADSEVERGFEEQWEASIRNFNVLWDLDMEKNGCRT